jgi:hypothetical protein
LHFGRLCKKGLGRCAIYVHFTPELNVQLDMNGELYINETCLDEMQQVLYDG